MKRAFLATSLVFALGGIVACGTKQDDKAPVAKNDAQKPIVATEDDATASEMAQEYERLPSTVIVRVPVDERGNELKDQAETRTFKGDLNDTSALEARFNSQDDNAFEMRMEASKELNGSALQGYDQGGYDSGYGNGSYYNGYRPHLISRIIRGAAWILSRPVVWAVRGFRYYRYDRQDCGCYEYGGQTYEAPSKPAYQPTYEPSKPTYEPNKGPAQGPAQGPVQGPVQKPNEPIPTK